MLGIGAIEILDADYCLGMCGHIILRINRTGKVYRVMHSMDRGWMVSESDDGGMTFTTPVRMQAQDFIDLLPKDHGWTYNTFIAAWAGFASGYERGLHKSLERNQR